MIHFDLSQDKADEWMKVFADLPIKLSKVFDFTYLVSDGNFLLRDLLPEINELLKKEPWYLSNFNNLLAKYNSTPFSLDQSKRVVVDRIRKQSNNYTEVPLLYTTECCPYLDSYSADVWNELETLRFFEANEYGRVDFINSLIALNQEGAFKTFSVKIRSATEEAIAIEAKVSLIDEGKRLLKSEITSNQYRYNSQTNKITKGKTFVKLTKDSKEAIIAEYLFSQTDIGTYTSWDDEHLMNSLFGKADVLSTDGMKKSLQDATQRLNNKFNNKFHLKKQLITWENNHFKRNY